VHRGIRLGFHYDSLDSRNERVAKDTLGKISALLNERTRYIYKANDVAFEFVPQHCPQQANVSDCGVHALYNTRVLIQRLMHPAYRPAQPWSLADIEPNTSQNRAELRALFQQKWIERVTANAERVSNDMTS